MKCLAIGNFERHSYAVHWQGIRYGFGCLDGVELQTLDFRNAVRADSYSNRFAAGSDLPIAAAVRDARADVVLFCLQDALTEALLDAANISGAVTAFWFCDIRTPDVRELAGRLDLLALTSVGLGDAYATAWGLDRSDVIWLPQGCLPLDVIPSADPAYSADIVHVGSWGHPKYHGLRRDVLGAIGDRFGRKDVQTDSGDGTTEGSGGLVLWNPTNDDTKVLVTRQLPRIYPSAKVSIGISDPIDGYHSNRLFLATGNGACYFCNDYRGLDVLFEPNEEVLVFDPFNIPALLGRLDFLLETSKTAILRRKETRAAGFRRAQAEHRYDQRVRVLWDAILQRRR